ncbi:NmrA family NAD(P)-binding protein [Nostocaceae cyanobacterium CENA369]|uniref:NmrA family NAD(P)-binding protein n=1 Tax=Dendronalium phyllosphericum CENA369 TaxID=1725256 RepID=A0A8J7LG03_9NOST|nr:NmrA family NAD(P)-binding protein [Dendronalium phyllosphericum]MBH8574399.1 NmrA family NAD(P)-binding protein [Dendronalium phyllosphericum CENA369]
MTSKKTVLLAGATGMLGSKIALALASKESIDLRIMVRSRKVNNEKKQQQINILEGLGVIVEGDLNDQESLEKACTGVDTVVSAVSGWEDVVVTGQLNLLAAAKKLGVSHFIPSDYTYNYFNIQLGDNYLSDFRIRVAQAVKESGLDYTFIMNGIFAEVFVSPFFNVFNFETGTAQYWGDGETQFDVTTIEDTAKYTAEAVVDPRAINTSFQVVGDVISMKEAVAAYEEVKGKKLTQTSKGSAEDLKAWIEQLKAENASPFSIIPAQYQWGMVTGKVKLENIVSDRYPHIKPKSLKDFFADSNTQTFELVLNQS